jgi:hypothetical protein
VSQEVLFLIFLALEAVMLVGIYQVILLKMIRTAVVRHWIEEIESGRIDLPVVLENYTASLISNIDALLFGWVDDEKKVHRGRIQKFYEGAAGKAAQVMSGDPATLGPQMLKELKGQPWYVQAIASKVLGPALERAGEASVEPAVATYSPGLARK